MVGSTTSVGGTLRCVTLAVRDDLALEKWTKFLEKVNHGYTNTMRVSSTKRGPQRCIYPFTSVIKSCLEEVALGRK